MMLIIEFLFAEMGYNCWNFFNKTFPLTFRPNFGQTVERNCRVISALESW